MDARQFITGVRATSSTLCRSTRFTTIAPFYNTQSLAAGIRYNSSKPSGLAAFADAHQKRKPAASSRPKPSTSSAFTGGLEGIEATLDSLGIGRSSVPTISSSSTPEEESSITSLTRDRLTSVRQSITSELAAPDAKPQINLRLKPTIGRTVHVDPGRGRDLAKSLVSLEMECNANQVRSDMFAQRYHVRRGQRKKLLKSARWRKLFKVGFKDALARVQRLRAMGW